MSISKKTIRNKFRKIVFQRDGYTCRGCNKKFSVENAENFLDAHHIMDRNLFKNGGYVKENGISLCKNLCHLKAEKYHISNGKEFELGFHPNDFYHMINSSFELAKLKDEN